MRFPYPAYLLALAFYVWFAPLPATNLLRAAPPTLTYLFPAGAQRGKTVEVIATGTFERWPVRAWVDRKGVEIKAAKDKGKLIVNVAADAVPGLCWIRLYDEQGGSVLRPFFIGTLPEIMEKEPNDEPKKPQVLSGLPGVVNGRLEKAGDVDSFAFHLRKGETLIASLEANRTLGSPMDAILQVLSADGFVLEENNDDHGLDPQIVFTAPKDGTYLVRTFAFPAQPDSGIRFAGGPAYLYRLTLTTGGFADYAFPLAVARGDKSMMEIIGWNIPAAAKKQSVKSNDASTITLWHPQLANTLEVPVERHRSIIETEPNDRKSPQSIALPVTISGRIDPPGDLDVYEFRAKKGQRLSFRADAGSVGSQLDPLLRLSDAAGKRLAEANDATSRKAGARDATLTFAIPQDGVYRLEVRDQNAHGSARHFYRLQAPGVEPDYALTVAADQFTLTSTKPLTIPVTIDRRNGFNRAIDITIEGLPAGVTAAAVQSTGAAGKSVMLRLETKNGPASAAIRIIGRVAGQADFTRTATAPRIKLPASTPYLWLTVTK
ncbi:MAG TPA: PPC domain-containing protein [Gemmataceae bacterium]|nr:PPC domain-containing protein [Gemmataceae bacterium]